jgi:hypothetical protein
MRDAYLDSMAKAMVEAVNTESYAAATGAMLNNSLAITAPYREAMEKSMLQMLQQLSLPSRQDIVALAERFANLEMRLDDMDAKLDRIERHTQGARPAPPTEPVTSTQKTRPVTQTPAVEPAATKRAAAVKQASPRKRAAKKPTR